MFSVWSDVGRLARRTEAGPALEELPRRNGARLAAIRETAKSVVNEPSVGPDANLEAELRELGVIALMLGLRDGRPG